MLSTATTFDAAGCLFQSARGKILAGDEVTARGGAALSGLGLAPMTAPGHL
ncbi:hypothetical protein [Nocardia sp. CDC160]|uniref:hypothetical protein n=1 Tax=Nocardia sp. CDC160 TaxID=3112166 RepID=UPI002DBD4BC3|nr:hypothetical protein [Nocardia sp. CDC160]MEC3919780.1 hypothetical protein [Nocardia sp. CDC160]